METIKIIDGVYCKASRGLWPYISPLIEYEGEHWRAGKYAKIKETKTRSFLDRRGGKFLIGFLPRVKTSLAERGIAVSYVGALRTRKPWFGPKLTNTEGTRPDQLLLQTGIASRCAHAQRGVVLAPTGVGKTTVAMLITSMYYPKVRILFLCHTISLLTQTRDEFARQGFKGIHLIGGDYAKGLDPNAPITMATVQTFSKIAPEKYCDLFEVILVDEAHHTNSIESQFGQILTNSIAPVKIGFTATLPGSRETKLALEGIIGPVVGNITIQQGVDMQIMAKPSVKLLSVPYNALFGDIKKYAELYSKAIVENRARNSLIAREALLFKARGLSTLIIVKEIMQGNNLVDILRVRGANCIFVEGKTPGETREQVKKQLNQKTTPIVICTAVWKEGVNIPSLNCVINACGGKSEIATLQAIGRGLRAIPGKDTVMLVDFLDPYKYLAQHAIKRLSIYVEAGWL